MNSLKNSIVAILLLGVSYGVYQVLTTPDPGSPTSLAESGIKIEYPGATTSTDASVANTPLGTGSTAGLGQPGALGQANGLGQSGQNPGLSRDNRSSMEQGRASLSGTSVPNANDPNANRFTTPGVGNAPTAPALGTFDPSQNRTDPIPPTSPPSMTSPSPRDPQPNPTPNLGGFSKDPNTNPPSSSPMPRETPQTQMSPIEKSSQGSSGFVGTIPDSNRPAEPETKNFQDTVRPMKSLDVNTAPATWMSTWQQGVEFAQQGNFRQSLAMLTKLESEPNLGPEHRQQLYRWLDSLAARVIYSTDHSFEGKPYECQANDTLMSVAQQWNVTVQLVYNVNADAITKAMPNNVNTSAPFPSGLILKKIQGPFRAVLDLKTGVLTLFAEDCYAGRFQAMNQDLSQFQSGVFKIQSKSAKDDPRGLFCMTLDSPQIALHAPSTATPPGPLDLVFSETESRDLFTLLTNGAEIKLVR